MPFWLWAPLLPVLAPQLLSKSVPLQRQRPTAHPCMDSPPGGGRMMAATRLRTGARRSPAQVLPEGSLVRAALGQTEPTVSQEGAGMRVPRGPA